MPRRFFAATDLTVEQVDLTGPEAGHMHRVLRMKPGEQVWLFDGQGQEVLATIRTISVGVVQLDVVERSVSKQSAASHITLATAVPKGDRFRWLIEKATELGVHRIVPLISLRSIVDPGQGKLDKLRLTIVEACKQCGRSRLMELTEPISWRECLESEFQGRNVFIAHPSGDAFNRLASDPARPSLFLIGPEGGFTDAEVAEATAAGARPIQLGPHILRIETAAIAIAAITSIALTSGDPDLL